MRTYILKRLLLIVPTLLLDRVAARTSDDVSDEEDAHY